MHSVSWCDVMNSKLGVGCELNVYVPTHSYTEASPPPRPPPRHNTVVLGSRASQEVIKVKDNPKYQAL